MNFMTQVNENFARNLKHLMETIGYKAVSLSKKTGGKVSPRMISYILTLERTPTIETAEILAGAFGLNGWQLSMPGPPRDLEEYKRIGRLVDAYQCSNRDGQNLIEMIAERERAHHQETTSVI